MSRPSVLREAAELAFERASSLENRAPLRARSWWGKFLRPMETDYLGQAAALRTFGTDLRTRADAVESGERRRDPWFRG